MTFSSFPSLKRQRTHRLRSKILNTKTSIRSAMVSTLSANGYNSTTHFSLDDLFSRRILPDSQLNTTMNSHTILEFLRHFQLKLTMQGILVPHIVAVRHLSALLESN